MSDGTFLTIPVSISALEIRAAAHCPDLVQRSGSSARFAYEEFLSGLDSLHTRRAYRYAVGRFLEWCDGRAVPLATISPGLVSVYLAELAETTSKTTRKLHLAAIRHFFDKAVERHAVVLNPAASVRGPRYSVTEGATPAIEPRDARRVIDSIGATTPRDLRDRAVVASLVYTASRAGAVAGMKREDYFTDGRQWYLRLSEKGGKQRVIPARHDLQLHMERYLVMAPPTASDGPLFLTGPGHSGRLSAHRMTAGDMLRMTRRRALAAGLSVPGLCCHSFRAGTATNLLEQGVDPAEVQYLLGHSDPRTTRLYDRRQLRVSRNIVERIAN